jgi:hypothetical protein
VRALDWVWAANLVLATAALGWLLADLRHRATRLSARRLWLTVGLACLLAAVVARSMLDLLFGLPYLPGEVLTLVAVLATLWGLWAGRKDDGL